MVHSFERLLDSTKSVTKVRNGCVVIIPFCELNRTGPLHSDWHDDKFKTEQYSDANQGAGVGLPEDRNNERGRLGHVRIFLLFKHANKGFKQK